MQNEKVFLRRLSKDDAEAIASMANDKDIYASTLNIPYPYSIDDANFWLELQEKQFEENRAYNFAIISKVDNAIVGVIGLNKGSANKGELGYWIGKKYWNQGYATSATSLLLSYAFNELLYNRVYSKHFASNLASGKVMQKNHMQYEGKLKMDELKDGVYHDIILYGLCKDDYLKNKERKDL